MILSFPIGTYLVFNSEIGNDITYEYPMDSLSLFLAGIGFDAPVEFELGDGFIVIWCAFLILFTVAMFGPKKNFVKTLQLIISAGKYEVQDNYIVVTVKWFSILVIPAVMLLAAFGVIPIVKAAVLGAILLLVMRTVSIQDAYESISWSVIFLIASLVPLGIAIQKTNLDEVTGNFIIAVGTLISGVENVNPIIILAVLYGVTFFLSAFISNAAVAVMLTPIGVMLATILNVDPRPLLVAICFGASCSFMTPMGYQTNMMVFGPGQYYLKDFFQMGIPLTLIFWITAVYCIPIFWPF